MAYGLKRYGQPVERGGGKLFSEEILSYDFIYSFGHHDLIAESGWLTPGNTLQHLLWKNAFRALTVWRKTQSRPRTGRVGIKEPRQRGRDFGRRTAAGVIHRKRPKSLRPDVPGADIGIGTRGFDLRGGELQKPKGDRIKLGLPKASARGADFNVRSRPFPALFLLGLHPADDLISIKDHFAQTARPEVWQANRNQALPDCPG